ncbi:translation initiation factor eIF3g [Clavulina sp. PMI_390]|nr:translation initiation factor eIF3g [Clavulina sp. PMI_390]
MAAVATPTKPINWADDEDDEFQGSDTIDANGIRTVIEYKTNEAGKRVKITRRIKRTLRTALVDHVVAERKQWAKFGADKGKGPGLDNATTTVAERVDLRLSAGNKFQEVEPDETAQLKEKLGAKKIMCRLCKGDHFTSKCPHKAVLAPLTGEDAGDADDMPVEGAVGGAPGPSAAGGKSVYVPPSLRAGAARGAGEMMGRPGGGNRDDLPTLRITNVSEDASEDDLRELFMRFGRVARVFLGRDRETGIGKGYAFVSYEDRAAAQKAIDRMNGFGYDNLILSVAWSQPREPRPGGA